MPNKLFIDSGNTRIKWGIHDGYKWIEKSSDNIKGIEKATKEIADKCESIWVSNVAGEEVKNKITGIAKKNNLHIYFLQPEKYAYGITWNYEYPDKLGTDRYAAMLGAKQILHVPENIIIVCCGTAITIDLLTKDSVFMGGIILPGLNMMVSSLISGTAQLKTAMTGSKFKNNHSSFKNFYENEIPNNTDSAVRAGIITAITGAIEKSILIWSHKLKKTDIKNQINKCLITGGDREIITANLHTNVPFEIYENLVLEGLLLVAKKHTDAKINT